MNLENTYIKPYPFCGSDVDSYKDSGDFIYPASRDKSVWSINCLEIYGGCGESISGSSPEDCIHKWQKQYNFEDSELCMFAEDWENHDDND